MEAAKADIERFVRKYPDKCVTPNGRVNVRPVRNIDSINVSSNNESLPTLTPSMCNEKRINDENRPFQAPHNASSSFELMNSSMESFILGVAGSAHSSSSTTTNRSSSRRSQRYEISSTTDADDDLSSTDVGFSRASNYTPAKMASVSSLPIEEKAPGPSSEILKTEDIVLDDPEDFFDMYQRISNRRIDSQRGELPEEPLYESADFGADLLSSARLDKYGKSNAFDTTGSTSNNPDEILDLIVCIQGRRMEDQRASLILPEIEVSANGKKKNGGLEIEDHDQLYNLIMTRQADRLDDQRSELGGRPRSCSALPMELPDDVTDLVIAMNAGRYESQRACLKPPCSSDSQLNMGQDANDNSPKRCVSSAATVSLSTTGTTSG
ncbi:G-protein-signaling modulator 1 [Aphelenchoides bicaudatus]|nr:G-protein-signaling modulator 1 [Aphelenchoides bicaudatus]